MNLRVGLCVYRNILPETFSSCLALEKEYSPVWQVQTGADVIFGRNKIAQATLEDWLLLTDADMAFKVEDVKNLFGSMELNKDIGALSAYYIKWDGSAVPVCNFKKKESGQWLNSREKIRRVLSLENDVGYVDSFGGGLLLIRGEALRSISKEDKFSSGYDDQGYYDADTGFCNNLQEAGWKTAVHFGIRIQHVGPTSWHPDIVKEMYLK